MEELFNKMVAMVRATIPHETVDVGLNWYGGESAATYYIRIKRRSACECCGRVDDYKNDIFNCGPVFDKVLADTKDDARAAGVEVVEVENG